MNHREISNFLDHINRYTEQEIIANMSDIKEYFRWIPWRFIKEYLEKILKTVDKSKILYELFKNEKKFSWWGKKLDFSERLKFGLEIEVVDIPLDEIRCIFRTNSIMPIMNILEIPIEISNAIIQNSDFKKKNEFNKWIFSSESQMYSSEASTPILQNTLFDLNQIVAICTLYKALNARLNGGTALHINVGVDYLECNEKAIENLLKIWGECEELLFKMANPEGEEIRVEARTMATPIKENIQNFFEEDGSVTLNTEGDMEKFLYQIQARNRMYYVVSQSGFGPENDVEYDLHYAKTDEEIFDIYHRYNTEMKKRPNEDDKVRWTSINFNHMKWNSDNPGRIEIRIFNSSLEPEIIFQDLLLVGKMFEVSLKNAKNPNYKKDAFERLFLHDVTEADKVNHLLDLLFAESKQKEIFKRRWNSVRQKRCYQQYRSGKDTFER